MSPITPENSRQEAVEFLEADEDEEIQDYLRRARTTSTGSGVDKDGLSAFNAEAAKYPQLGEDDQIRLVVLYQKSLQAKQAVEAKVVPTSDIPKARRMVRQGEEAITYLARSNFRLNLRICGELVTRARGDLDRSRSQELRMELFSEGNGAIVKAAQEFDIERGKSWTTFMARKIRDSVRMSLAADNPTNMPASAMRLLRLINPTKGDLLGELGREGSREELVQALYEKSLAWAFDHLNEEELLLGPAEQHEAALAKMKKQGMAKAIREIADILPWLPSIKSLDQPAGGEGRSSLGEIAITRPVLDVGDEESGALFSSRVEVEEAASDLEASLAILPERDADIIRMRFTMPPYEDGRPDDDGLPSGERYTHKDIAAKYSVTPERIRQLENAALAKLRGPHAHYAALAAHMGSQFTEAANPGDTREAVSRKIGRSSERP